MGKLLLRAPRATAKRFGGKRLARAASSQIIDQNFVHGGALGAACREVKTVL
jgi:hypothetical protein